MPVKHDETTLNSPGNEGNDTSLFSPLETFGYTLLLLIGLQFLAPLIILPFYLVAGHSVFELTRNMPFLLVTTFLWQLLAIALLCWLVKIKKGTLSTYFRLVSVSKMDVARIVVSFISVILLLEVLSRLLDVQPNQMMLQMIRENNPILVFTVLVLLAPFFEELVFRGFLFNEIEKSLGALAAITAPALLFAIIHLQYGFQEQFMVALIALILGFLRYRYRNLWIPIGVHTMNNLISIVFYVSVYH